MFYVYEWYIEDTNEIIYVGKGTKNRYKVKKHNWLFQKYIEEFNCSSRIVKYFDDEQFAFEYERIHIDELQEIGQCKCNLQKGGYGGSTNWWTDELRKYYSENNVMKSDKQRKRMSINNPMKNKESALKMGLSKRKSLIIGNNEFSSVNEAMNFYNVSCSEVIKHWCQKGINPYGETCRYKNQNQVEFKGKRYNKGGCKSLTYKNQWYESAIDLARELKIHPTTVLKWLKKGFDSKGNPCRYDNDNRELIFKSNKYAKKAVIVNGVRYESIRDAAKSLGVCPDTIKNSLEHRVKSKNLICEYDNQQPSHTNSDNSSVEGSTTNG